MGQREPPAQAQACGRRGERGDIDAGADLARLLLLFMLLLMLLLGEGTG